MGLDNVEHSTVNWISDFSMEEVKFDHEEELMLCSYESFCMEYKLKCDKKLHLMFNVMTCYIFPLLHPFLFPHLHLMRHCLV